MDDRPFIGPGSQFRDLLVQDIQSRGFESEIVLAVTGGRDFDDAYLMAVTLGLVHSIVPVSYLLHGDARGADRMAARWASHVGVSLRALPSRWKADGRGAGPLRNQAMVDLLLRHSNCLCVAFPGGSGTFDMITRCRENRVPLIDITQFL